MAIPRRGSRTIVVAHARFRWRVTEPEAWMESAAPWKRILQTRRLTLAVQDDTMPGMKLLARVPVYRRVIRKDDVETLSTPRQDVSITPALVHHLIEHALHEGWRPKEAGSDFVVSADDIDRSIRRTVDARMLALIDLLSDVVNVRLLTELTHVGERRLMLELLCEQLHETDRALSEDALDKVMSLAGELGIDRLYTRDLAGRVGASG